MKDSLSSAVSLWEEGEEGGGSVTPYPSLEDTDTLEEQGGEARQGGGTPSRSPPRGVSALPPHRSKSPRPPWTYPPALTHTLSPRGKLLLFFSY